MAVAPKCDECGDAHWPYQAHRFAKAVERLVDRGAEVAAREFVQGVVDAAGSDAVCEVCGTEFLAKRSDARFCSGKCRQVSSRKRRSK